MTSFVGERELGWKGLLQLLEHTEEVVCNEDRLGNVLKCLVQQSLDINNRKSITESDIALLSSLLNLLYAKFTPSTSSHTHTPTPPLVTCLGEGLKLVRNLCAGVPSNQERIVHDAGILPSTVHLCQHLVAPHMNSDLSTLSTPILKLSLQLLGNTCVNFEEGQTRVWQLCFPDVFKHLLDSGVSEVMEMVWMVIHTCTVSNADLRNHLCGCYGPCDLISRLLCCLATDTNEEQEWTLILMESLFTSVAMETLWSCLDNTPPTEKNRLTLLHFALSKIDQIDSNNADSANMLQTDLSVESSKVICERDASFYEGLFCRHCRILLSNNDAVLHSVNSTGCEDSNAVIMIQTTITVLQLLCACLVHKKLLLTMQASTTLLEDSTTLLKQLCVLDGSHTSGRHRSRLSITKPTGKEAEYPLYGFKRDLVRLIGNLSFQNRNVQDRLRELGAVQLILNLCSIDHYNPYIFIVMTYKLAPAAHCKKQPILQTDITQWSVFAIRNLCEENPANQELIGTLENQGVADTQAWLEFGCEVEIGDDGRIKVKQKNTSKRT